MTSIVSQFLSAWVSNKNIVSFAACPQAPTELSLLRRRSSKVISHKVNSIGKTVVSV